MTEQCCPGCNVAPYDAVETPDEKNKRPDWVRSDCRLCGRFLGFRPIFEAEQNKKDADENLLAERSL